jgi:hypothetical protein
MRSGGPASKALAQDTPARALSTAASGLVTAAWAALHDLLIGRDRRGQTTAVLGTATATSNGKINSNCKINCLIADRTDNTDQGMTAATGTPSVERLPPAHEGFSVKRRPVASPV